MLAIEMNDPPYAPAGAGLVATGCNNKRLTMPKYAKYNMIHRCYKSQFSSGWHLTESMFLFASL